MLASYTLKCTNSLKNNKGASKWTDVLNLPSFSCGKFVLAVIKKR